MYGALRFLYNNFIDSYADFTLSSQATGRKSGIAKDGEGVATMKVAGNFAGAFDLTYTLEIDSVTGGTEVGEATFKWRTSDTTIGGWEETGVLTRTHPAYALSADGLGTGLSVSHTGATGNDFALGDSWQWECRATYGSQRLLDRNRMTKWRTTVDASVNAVIDLGSAMTPTVFVLHDHNLTDAATVTLQGHASDSWGDPTDSHVCTIQDPIVEYISAISLRYWRPLIVDAANPDTYIEASNIFLGSYLELSHLHAVWGLQHQPGFTLQQNESEAGVQRRYAYAAQQSLNLTFGQTLSNTDIDALITMQEALIDTDVNTVDPLWVHLFSDVDASLKLMNWDNIGSWRRAYSSYLLNSQVALQLSEVVKI